MLLSFIFSKVQTQLLSSIKFNFTSLSTLKFHPILDPLNIVGRFLTLFVHKDSQCFHASSILLANHANFKNSCAKFSFSSRNFSKFRKKSKVKDCTSSHLSQINSLLIEIDLKAIRCQDRTSIFSQGNSSNKLNFYDFFKFAKKFVLKEINYGETIHLIKNYHS